MDAVKRQHLEELSQISSKGANAAQRTKLELSTQVHELEATLSRAKEVFANKVGSSTHDCAVGLASNALVRRRQVARLKMENAHEVDSLANEVDRLAAARDREFVQMREEHETRVTKLEKSLKQEQRARRKEAAAAEAAAKKAAEDLANAVKVGSLAWRIGLHAHSFLFHVSGCHRESGALGERHPQQRARAC